MSADRMRLLVVYDVTNDALRTRLAALLGGYGTRVQHSVFECALTEADEAVLVHRLRGLLGDARAAEVRIYRLCRACHRASIRIGTPPPASDGGPIVIL